MKVPSQYARIQDAIDRSSPGDTILVSAGRYMEDLKLKERLVLRGEGAATTIIEGTGIASVIEGAKGAAVEGFTITGSGAKGTIGVTMDAAISCNNAPMTIANNRITGNNTGLKLYYSPSNIINNEITSSANYGIYLVYSDSLVSNNIISKSKVHGIYNSYSNPEIVSNTITGNATGIYSEVSRVVVKDNIIASNMEGVRWAEFVGSQDRAEPLFSHNVFWKNGEDYINVERPVTDASFDPLLTDLPGGDVRLKPGSSALKSAEGGKEAGAFGGRFAQKAVPSATKGLSYAGLSLKERLDTIREPDYMMQTGWRSDAVKYGKGDYEGHCVPCHGPQGRGDGLLSDTLDVRPRDLSDSSVMSTRTDEMLHKVIKEGGTSLGFSASMMSFNNQFNDEEIGNIIRYIRSEICRCAAPSAAKKGE